MARTAYSRAYDAAASCMEAGNPSYAAERLADELEAGHITESDVYRIREEIMEEYNHVLPLP